MIKNKAGSYRAQNLGLKWQERGLYRVQNGFRIVDISKHTLNPYHAKQICSLFGVCVNLYFIGLVSLNINNSISLKTKIIMTFNRSDKVNYSTYDSKCELFKLFISE